VGGVLILNLSNYYGGLANARDVIPIGFVRIGKAIFNWQKQIKKVTVKC